MPLRPSVAGKRFHRNPRPRPSSLLRTASIVLIFTASFFVFFDFRVTSRPAEPLIPIDHSHTSTDPEFADLPSVDTPSRPFHQDDPVPNDISFAQGLEQGSPADHWGRDDGPPPIPLPPHDAPVAFPEPVIPPLLRSSSWQDPIQPILDPARFINTNDLRVSFGILPTNRTLVDQRLATALENYDIREDDRFRQLAIYANLTSIFLRYNHLVRRGWGSLFPSDPSDQPRDHVYHVCHSGNPQKGYGVYASVDIPAETILGLYGGELVDAATASDGQYAWEAPAMTMMDPITRIKRKHVMVLEASRIGGLLRFVNDLGERHHNVDATWVPIDNRWNLFYFARKNITAGDELSIAYGARYWSFKSGSNKSSDRSYHDQTSQGTTLDQNLSYDKSLHVAERADHEPIGTGQLGDSDDRAQSEVLQRAPDLFIGSRPSSLTDREPEIQTDHHLTPTKSRVPVFRKVALRKQYLEYKPPLSTDFVKPPTNHHAQGTRYS